MASLAIDRFRITGVAPGDHPAPDRVRSALDRIDPLRLTQAIATELGSLGADDERVIVLRRLDIAMTESRIDDADGLARRLAQGLAAAVAQLATADATESVTVFASPAARLAAFVAGAVRGDAWGRWWFADFEDLRILPVSSAVRAALCRDPSNGLEALAALGEADRVRVVATLSAIDAEQMLDLFAGLLCEDEDEDIWIEAFARPPNPPDWPTSVAIVHDLAALASRAGGVRSRSLLTAPRIRAALMRGPAPATAAAATRSVSGRTLSALGAAISPRDLGSLLALSAATRVRIADAIEAAGQGPVDKAQGFTRFGGLLLLWPHLPRVDVAQLPEGPGEPSALLALLSLAAVTGRRDSSLALNDSVLRMALGVEGRATEDDLVEWLRRVPVEALPAGAAASREIALPRSFARCRRQYRRIRTAGHAALADLARRLPGLAGASPGFLRANLVGVGSQVLVQGDTVHATLDRPPLDVLLSISGLADRSVELPGGRTLELERAP